MTSSVSRNAEIVGRRDTDRPAASTNTMSRFETEVLTQDGNVEGLGRLNAKWVDGAMSRTPHRRVILDMDSSESPVHGEQEGASYNGHFGSMCYHPLFVFNQFGDCEGAMLRAGNVHSAHKWRQVLEPILSRYAETGLRRYFRADAAFAKPDIYEYLEERRVFYAIRLPSNKVLQYEIAPLLIRPVGRPPKRPVILYDDFWYRAGSWDRARRVVAKVEWHRGELFPRVGFIVTNWVRDITSSRTVGCSGLLTCLLSHRAGWLRRQVGKDSGKTKPTGSFVPSLRIFSFNSLPTTSETMRQEVSSLGKQRNAWIAKQRHVSAKHGSLSCVAGSLLQHSKTELPGWATMSQETRCK